MEDSDRGNLQLVKIVAVCRQRGSGGIFWPVEPVVRGWELTGSPAGSKTTLAIQEGWREQAHRPKTSDAASSVPVMQQQRIETLLLTVWYVVGVWVMHRCTLTLWLHAQLKQAMLKMSSPVQSDFSPCQWQKTNYWHERVLWINSGGRYIYLFSV